VSKLLSTPRKEEVGQKLTTTDMVYTDERRRQSVIRTRLFHETVLIRSSWKVERDEISRMT